MSYFEDVYKKRLNRYGLDYQSRVQGEREKLFDLYLLKSLYRVEFSYGETTIVGSLEKYRQDETKTIQYLLVRTDVNMPSGTILTIPDKDGNDRIWMVYFLENIEASGYNRYTMLKMTHQITWTARDASTQTSWAYVYGQQDNMLKDELRSRSRMDTIYGENIKMSFFVIPTNDKLKKDDYLEIEVSGITESYRVTGYDILSTPGVEYVTVDPTYKYDLTPAPTPAEGVEPDESYYWLNGGNIDGSI